MAKNIILGVCGGIAAYKAAFLVRRLKEEGNNIFVVMTRNARKFITPLTFQTLSNNMVATGLFANSSRQDRLSSPMEHIDLAEKGELLLVAPATANIIGKFAHGIADDLMSTLFLSMSDRVIIAPALNEKMFFHPAVQDNLKRLKQIGIGIIEPEYGRLACGAEGKGRMAEIETIVSQVKNRLKKNAQFEGKKVLITCGPTREPLDKVRYISNYSSGKMGRSLCEAALQRGAEVTLISGPAAISYPPGINYLPVETSREMELKILEQFPFMEIIIMAAAVADFRPRTVQRKKIKKKSFVSGKRGDMFLEFIPTPDILNKLKKNKGEKIIVGFAAETGNLEKEARKKLKEKELDLIIANEVSKPEAVFGSDYNQVLLISRKGEIEDLPRMSKRELAEVILDRIGMIFS